jgi:hypothetical protein
MMRQSWPQPEISLSAEGAWQIRQNIGIRDHGLTFVFYKVSLFLWCR